MYQNNRSRKHNKNGIQPCTKTIDQENTIKMDYSHVPKTIDQENTIKMEYSHVPKQSIKRTQYKWITAMYQNNRSREHNKNGIQPCTKTIDQENTMNMDNSDVPKPSIQKIQ